MLVYDANSFLGVVGIPVIGGLVGLLVLGPIGFFIGLVVPLVVGANMQSDERETAERIAELERRVEELEDDSET